MLGKEWFCIFWSDWSSASSLLFIINFKMFSYWEEHMLSFIILTFFMELYLLFLSLEEGALPQIYISASHIISWPPSSLVSSIVAFSFLGGSSWCPFLKFAIWTVFKAKTRNSYHPQNMWEWKPSKSCIAKNYSNCSNFGFRSTSFYQCQLAVGHGVGHSWKEVWLIMGKVKWWLNREQAKWRA